MDSMSQEANDAYNGEDRTGQRNDNASSPPQIEETNQTVEVEAPAATATATQAVANANNFFNFFVGPNLRRFAVDINDLQRESALFRESQGTTSLELRHENPDAAELIENWFSGNIGQPPITEEARNLFEDAARIASQLQITECANQLLVIIRKTESFLATIVDHQAQGLTNYSSQEVTELVQSEMEGYMRRSTNVGGRDEDSEDDEMQMAEI